ncbi:MAG: hypothetical protein L3J69_00080 [Desulfobacula sp.]|nr:hypothetical protein [Desulfobacula sp.]
MNDFLQTLRNGSTERHRTPMTRKSYDQTFYNSTQRYQYSNRPVPKFILPNQMTVEASVRSPLQKAIENLNDYVQLLSQNQKNLIDVQEKTADILERQVCAIEKILDHYILT